MDPLAKPPGSEAENQGGEFFMNDAGGMNIGSDIRDPEDRVINERDEKPMRPLMVQGAHYILGPFGQDSDRRRWGRKLAERGGKNAKKRAVVAVARKLSVLLHKLWVSGEVYEPLRNNNRKAARAVA